MVLYLITISFTEKEKSSKYLSDFRQSAEMNKLLLFIEKSLNNRETTGRRK